MTPMKPKISVGSSSERLDITRAIQTNLDHDFDPVLWTRIFPPTVTGIESLLIGLNEFSYGIFVMSADDLTHAHGAELLRNYLKSPRPVTVSH